MRMPREKRSMNRDELLEAIKGRLKDVYGDRLRGVVLYGSYARGEEEEDSDIDLLVLLSGPVAFGEELRKIIQTLYPLQLEIVHPVHATPVSVDVYEAGEFALYRNAKKEGILL
jgi:predicted nucleotidyltransferase